MVPNRGVSSTQGQVEVGGGMGGYEIGGGEKEGKFYNKNSTK